MEQLLSVLLYLGAVCSPCEYYDHQIEAKEAEYADEIDLVMDDSAYLNQVVDDYGDEASKIVIYFEDEEG